MKYEPSDAIIIVLDPLDYANAPSVEEAQRFVDEVAKIAEQHGMKVRPHTLKGGIETTLISEGEWEHWVLTLANEGKDE